MAKSSRRRFDSGELERLDTEFESADPRDIVDWAIERFPSTLALSVSFGGDGGTVLAHMIANAAPPVPVLFLNTGLLFPETHRFREQLSLTLGLNVIDVLPELTVVEQEARYGAHLWDRAPDQCCQMRKVDPMLRALRDFDGWMTGIRRSQSATRSTAGIVSYDPVFDVIKICPLANASDAFVTDYIKQHDLPHNPLQDQGYTSIGCWPCTSRVAAGEDARAGRWRNRAKIECGLHRAAVKERES